MTVEVPVASIPKIEVGQEAAVTPPGSVTTVEGSVEQVGLLPTDTTGTAPAPRPGRPTPSWSLVPEATATLASGARAPVSIRVGTATRVLTVPNSAITTVERDGRLRHRRRATA